MKWNVKSSINVAGRRPALHAAITWHHIDVFWPQQSRSNLNSAEGGSLLQHWNQCIHSSDKHRWRCFSLESMMDHRPFGVVLKLTDSCKHCTEGKRVNLKTSSLLYLISELFIASVHHPALIKLTFKILCLSHHCLIVCLLHRHCMKTVLWQNFTPRCKSLSNIVCFHLSLLCELCTVPQLPYQKWVEMDEIFDFC